VTGDLACEDFAEDRIGHESTPLERHGTDGLWRRMSLRGGT
jgi:hypothetical protein